MPRTHAWHTSKGVGAAEYRAKLRGPGRPSLKSRLQADVVELYRSGVTQGSIALRLRCSLSTVRRALADAGETAKRQR
jgi:DNA invertase Pin-like site-specific DNA recombinase